MGKVDRLRNRVELFAALFWALGILLYACTCQQLILSSYPASRCTSKTSQDKTSQWTKSPKVPRDKTSQRQNVPRDKNVPGTKRHKGTNEALYLTFAANWMHGWGQFPNICGQFSDNQFVFENFVISVGRFVPWDVLSLGTFCPWDLMSWNVLSWDVLPLGTFCLGTFCLCTNLTSPPYTKHVLIWSWLVQFSPKTWCPPPFLSRYVLIYIWDTVYSFSSG